MAVLNVHTNRQMSIGLNHCISSRQSRGMTTKEWIDRAKQVHGDKYDYSLTDYVNQRTM